MHLCFAQAILNAINTGFFYGTIAPKKHIDLKFLFKFSDSVCKYFKMLYKNFKTFGLI